MKAFFIGVFCLSVIGVAAFRFLRRYTVVAFWGRGRRD